MLASGDACFICGSTKLAPGTRGYSRCLECGHETRVQTPQAPKHLINEALDPNRIRRLDAKDRFQVSLAKNFGSPFELLIDIGCGPGRFLNHARSMFRRSLGVEISPEPANFARKELQLDIREDVPLDSLREASVITMWHSLEHFPKDAIEKLLLELKANLPRSSHIVISVPNAGGLHAKVFGARSVYYDYDHHVHQFTSRSLNRLMLDHGFKEVSSQTSFAYSLLGNALSFLNFFGPHNYLYFALRRSNSRPTLGALALLPLLALAFVPALLIYAYELVAPRNGAVLTSVFKAV